jgi:hypothetical protein
MHYSKPSLHHPVLKSQAHKELLRDTLSSIAERRRRAVAAPKIPPTVGSVDIPLTTVSLESNFDAHMDIRYRGSAADVSIPLLIDSGNSSLIVPDFTELKALPNFNKDYAILADDVTEPWGCPARIVRGPIEIPTRDGVYEISDCVFYACTGPNKDGELTANFGTGCISPWISTAGIQIKAPLTYNTAYPYAELNYAAAEQIFSTKSGPQISQGSSLILHKSRPTGYKMFDIVKNLMWMSLIPQSLAIGTTRTGWPGKTRSPIAMIDTGGGPVFLSDPNGYVYQTNWPDQVPSPSWTSPGSVSCRSTKDDISIVLGDGQNSFSYRVDTTKLPASVQGLTLVMCEMCSYMMGNQGMNIGGVSALFNSILIDYGSAKVGFKPKAH